MGWSLYLGHPMGSWAKSTHKAQGTMGQPIVGQPTRDGPWDHPAREDPMAWDIPRGGRLLVSISMRNH
jgi:hypothetical protein